MFVVENVDQVETERLRVIEGGRRTVIRVVLTSRRGYT